jgi:hypothetical protein
MAGHGCRILSPDIRNIHVCSICPIYNSFILEGLVTFVCAAPAWWLIPDFPEDGRVLRGIDQKRWLHRLHENQGVTNASIPFSMKQIRAAFLEWKVYVYALM